MTATVHIARRTTPHNLLATLTSWATGRLRRRPSAPDTVALDIEALRLALPLDDPDRHALENPAVEGAFAHLAVDHPSEAAATAMRAADHETLLLAQRDVWFRHAHPAPEHRWSPQEIAAYNELMGSVCVRRFPSAPGGEA